MYVDTAMPLIRRYLDKNKRFFPGDDWVRDNLHSESFTPDYMWLERHEFCLLFVCDDLMLNRRHYERLIGQDSVSLAHAFTHNRNFALWKKRLGEESFPIPLEGADRMYDGHGIISRPLAQINPDKIKRGHLGRIKGEVHAIKPHLFWRGLDEHYLNGVEFVRERVKVLVPYHIEGIADSFVQPVRCWMYVGVKEYWNNLLDGGYMFAPVGIYKPNAKWVDGHPIGPYYAYTRLEDDTNF